MIQLSLHLPARPRVFWPVSPEASHSDRTDAAELAAPPLLSPWQETGDCEQGSAIRFWIHPDGAAPLRLVAAVVRYVTNARERGWWIICHQLHSGGERVRRCRRRVENREAGLIEADRWLRSDTV